MCKHTIYTCQTSGNSLDVFDIFKNPYFDPLHNSVAPELKIILSFIYFKMTPGSEIQLKNFL